MKQKWVDAEGLKHIVQAAFADVAYPGDDNITISQCPCTECQDTRDFFRGKRWQELADRKELMQYCWGGLSILSPEAWQFYLPTYLIIELDEGTEDYLQSCPSEEARETLISNLSPLGRTGHLVQWFEERVALLSEEQRKCLAIYVTQAYSSKVSELEGEWESEDAAAVDLEDENYKAAASFWGHLISI